MGQDIRWGIVGTGQIASCFAGDCAHASGAEATAVCSRKADTAQAFAARFGIEHTFTALDAMLDSGTIDALYIATPHPAHGPAIDAALAAGLPCLVEKPMVMASQEAQRLFDDARSKGVFLMEALWTRFLPAFQAAREAVRNGAIGTITGLDAELAFLRPYDETSRLFAPELGGSALYDLGVYPLAAADFFLGPAQAVNGRWVAAPSGVDMAAQMTYTAGDATARLRCGFDREGVNLCVVSGTEGTLIVGPPFNGAQRYHIVRNGTAARLLTHSNTLVRKIAARLPLPGVETHHHPHRGTGLEYEIEAASASIRAGEIANETMPAEATITALRTIEGVLANPPE